MSGGLRAEVVYYQDSLKIKDCYKLDRKARLELLSMIYSDTRDRFDRTIMSMEGELAAHCYLYHFGIEKASTVEADLECVCGDRWYVRFVSALFQILGV